MSIHNELNKFLVKILLESHLSILVTYLFKYTPQQIRYLFFFILFKYVFIIFWYYRKRERKNCWWRK
jgi:hypothetical protein